jgi:5-oxopent-3-ene-1,2,5-tricarboxylate decarboxylase / 2-hydroxyhepta-2,4-diene-1,7-dioate isomerase
MKHARVLVDGVVHHAVQHDDTLVLETGDRIAVTTARFLSPVVPRQIFATHLTYRSRCVEYRMASPPEYPSYFIKALGSVSSHRVPVARPRGCAFLNYEGELAVVIGRRCSGATIDNALTFVKGYTIADDFGVHDFRHADRGAMLRVKGQDGFCPLGPVLVDRAEFDLEDAWLRTYVNGTLAQEARIGSDLMFSVAYQVADLSRLITLEENDVILTGTPAHSRPVEIGDVVTVEITGIGTLENTIVELERDLEPYGYPPAITEQTLHVALAVPEEEARAMVRATEEANRG